MPRIHMLNRALYTLAVAGSLAFGTTQAFAAATPQQTARYCDEKTCRASCDGAGGCSNGRCICF